MTPYMHGLMTADDLARRHDGLGPCLPQPTSLSCMLWQLQAVECSWLQTPLDPYLHPLLLHAMSPLPTHSTSRVNKMQALRGFYLHPLLLHPLPLLLQLPHTLLILCTYASLFPREQCPAGDCCLALQYRRRMRFSSATGVPEAYAACYRGLQACCP